jgi:putative AlgH/UPF0301 family transcriptional regulator
MGMNYENGQTYIVNHSRKGTFGLRVDSQDDEWLHGEVVGGVAKAIMDYNVKETGEPITVRKCLIKNSKAA